MPTNLEAGENLASMRVSATPLRVFWTVPDLKNPRLIFPRLHQPWGLTAATGARRFVLILDNILADKSHASRKEAELERVEIENRQIAFSFSLPHKGNGS
jgi:hypothetical protein